MKHLKKFENFHQRELTLEGWSFKNFKENIKFLWSKIKDIDWKLLVPGQIKKRDEENYSKYKIEKTGPNSMVRNCIKKYVQSLHQRGKFGGGRLIGYNGALSVCLSENETSSSEPEIIVSETNTYVFFHVEVITEDNEIVKNSLVDGSSWFYGHEWVLKIRIKKDILNDLLNKDDSPETEDLIIKGFERKIFDGMSDSGKGHGWQKRWIQSRQEIKKESEQESKFTKNLRKIFYYAYEWHPFKIIEDIVTGKDDPRPWKGPDKEGRAMID